MGKTPPFAAKIKQIFLAAITTGTTGGPAHVSHSAHGSGSPAGPLLPRAHEIQVPQCGGRARECAADCSQDPSGSRQAIEVN